MIAGDAGDMTAFLARLLLRSELSPDAQRAILGLRTRVVRTPARRDIVMPGETVDHACLVVSGLLGRFDQVLDGNRQITALYVRGDMCDLHSVVAPTTAWGLTALSATVTLRVPHSALKALVTEHPQIAFALWRDTTADASILAKWVSNLGQKSARARLAHLLCEVGVRLELAGAGDRTSYAFDVSQEQLGSILGLTSIHVNRTLQALRTATIVTAREHRVEVSDWASLAAIAEFSPDFLLLSRNHAAA
jgi:CRP-like cAMP-binding protein